MLSLAGTIVVGWIGPPTTGSCCCTVGCCGWLLGEQCQRCRLGTWQTHVFSRVFATLRLRHPDIHSVRCYTFVSILPTSPAPRLCSASVAPVSGGCSAGCTFIDD